MHFYIVYQLEISQVMALKVIIIKFNNLTICEYMIELNDNVSVYSN